MDEQDHVGGEGASRELLSHVDILRRSIALRLIDAGDIAPAALERLAEKFSGGDPSLKNTLLRRWGVR